jgi:hypothetical protein
VTTSIGNGKSTSTLDDIDLRYTIVIPRLVPRERKDMHATLKTPRTRPPPLARWHQA